MKAIPHVTGVTSAIQFRESSTSTSTPWSKGCRSTRVTSIVKRTRTGSSDYEDSAKHAGKRRKIELTDAGYLTTRSGKSYRRISTQGSYGCEEIINLTDQQLRKIIATKQQLFNLNPLKFAIRTNDTALLLRLLNLGALPDEFERGLTPVGMAVLYERKSMLETLHQWQADVNLKDLLGDTPLILALKKECRCMVGLLIELGADIAISDAAGWTPLHIATRKDDVVHVNNFINMGGDVNQATKKGQTPFITAVRNNNIPIASMLRKGGANVNQVDAKGWTSLLHAIELHNTEMAFKIISWDGYYQPSKPEDGLTPLILAVEEGLIKVVEALICVLNDLDERDNAGNSALLRAIEFNHEAIAKLLLDAGADVNVGNSDFWTPLALAAFRGNRAMFGYMVANSVIDLEKKLDGHKTQRDFIRTMLPFEKNAMNYDEVLGMCQKLIV